MLFGHSCSLPKILILIGVLTVGLLLRLQWQGYNIIPHSRAPVHKSPYHAQIEFWTALEDVFSSNPPGVPKPERESNVDAVSYDAVKEIPFPELIKMPADDVATMKRAHQITLEKIQVKPPNLVYTPGTRGIVYTAGGPYLPLVVISLRLLRRAGSSLPAEVFLGSNREYEPDICEETLPGLNAKCVILPEIMNTLHHAHAVGKYQLKIFAILFSTFEELLFLDADAFALHDPDPLFTSEPFTSSGMVTWPDFWHTTESQYYFEISSTIRPASTLRASSETGEILISKKNHQKTLLLAAYYNYYGPKYYYPLLSQGAPGEGDKETFLAAARAVNEPYYAVSETIRAIGHYRDDHSLDGSAMVQFDPREDYRLRQLGLYRVKDQAVAPPIPPFFVHVNFPKFNPGNIYDREDIVRHNGTYRRAWTDSPETMQLFDSDVEKVFWEEASWTACHLEDKFRDWEQYNGTCDKAQQHFKEVFG